MCSPSTGRACDCVPARATGATRSDLCVCLDFYRRVYAPPAPHTHQSPSTYNTPHAAAPTLNLSHFGLNNAQHDCGTAGAEPERLATKASGVSGPVRIQEQNRTDCGTEPRLPFLVCACVCRVPCCGHKPNAPRRRSTNSAREVGGRPRMRSTTSVTSEAPPITSRNGCALGATAVCSSYDRGSTRT